MAKKYSLDKTDMTNLVKVAVYSGIASFLGVIIANTGDIDIPANYGFIVPIVNVILVAVKDFLENRI